VTRRPVLVLSADETGDLITMDECIEACEEAFRELGHGIAQVIPRRRITTPRRGQDRIWHWLNVIPGAIPGMNVAAVRVDSATMRYREVRGSVRQDFPGDFAGLVLLFDLTTSELLCIYHDHHVSPMRVGATSAIGVRHMARQDASVLGIIGTGGQAVAKVEGITRVRPIRLVKAYSLNPEHRRAFAERMEKRLGIEARPMEDARSTVEGADIVAACTNSAEPVFRGEWLEPGCHVIANITSSRFDQRREIDVETVRRAGRVVVNLREQVEIDQQPEVLDPIRLGYLRWEDVHELADLVTGRMLGRHGGAEITHHNNNTGLGIQFAAAGAVIYRNAVRAGRGTPLAPELFMTYRGRDDDVSSP
jgi:ornithine cyclodeaminase/alanine dehydrogenase-like protein (mu-crystallin family)